MLLGEAVLYLKRAVKKIFGPEVTVRLVNSRSPDVQGKPWKGENPQPLVIIDDEVVFKGDFSVKKIVEEARRRMP
ncbi:MAG TPA: hypothetical protein GXZ85_05855 [Firmicutes bacterium]|jgi:disulfide oxidoreductase YuzD|nr:hypothetical protein [Bacillota bacterium]